MSKKQRTRKQHFVPQFYLRSFADADGRHHIFDTGRRIRKKPRPSKTICQEDYFYGQVTGQDDDVAQMIEEHFSQNIEKPVSEILPELIEKLKGTEQILPEEKHFLASFMNHMWLRSPFMRDMIKRTTVQTYEQITKIMFSGRAKEISLQNIKDKTGEVIDGADIDEALQMMDRGELKIEVDNREHIKFMLEAETNQGFANLLYGQDWIIHISRAERKFMTSNNPVVVIQPKRKGLHGASFLERTHLFPLTPDVLIEARPPRQGSTKKIKRKTYYGKDLSEIDRLNILMMDHSSCVYAARPEEIAWCEGLSGKIEDMQDKVKKVTAALGITVEEFHKLTDGAGKMSPRKVDDRIKKHLKERVGTMPSQGEAVSAAPVCRKPVAEE